MSFRNRSLDKPMHLAGMSSEWEGGLHRNLPGRMECKHRVSEATHPTEYVLIAEMIYNFFFF